MNVDEVKKWLNRAYKIDELIQIDKRKLEELATVAPCIPISEKVQTSKKLSANFENKVFKIDEQRRKLNNRIVERYNIKMEIDEAINSVSDNEIVQVLDYRYLQFLKFRDIASVCYMSVGKVQHLHDKGITLLTCIVEKIQNEQDNVLY
ncbi:hypothetical protein EQF93_02615 [Helcococcus ovis]|uniref:hypothetical protein n=1 Tax=Helcococcus ovis TaxID=72026 RepID=UPI00106F371F|nr:hypothetical protein [Helcococcus ovis]TFF68348.1 hypothetical protein EQF93_02615 [Helcococcus ovis]WNZ00897.1 hypothetical protein EQF90_006425 [Helcococcus ovis]